MLDKDLGSPRNDGKVAGTKSRTETDRWSRTGGALLGSALALGLKWEETARCTDMQSGS